MLYVCSILKKKFFWQDCRMWRGRKFLILFFFFFLLSPRLIVWWNQTSELDICKYLYPSVLFTCIQCIEIYIHVQQAWYHCDFYQESIECIPQGADFYFSIFFLINFIEYFKKISSQNYKFFKTHNYVLKIIS